MISDIIKHTRRFVVFVIGSTILLIGIMFIVLPGPAFIVIPIALAILATEFVWARALLKKVENEIDKNKTASKVKNSIKQKFKKSSKKKKN